MHTFLFNADDAFPVQGKDAVFAALTTEFAACSTGPWKVNLIIA
jgi:hypothetical protein